MKGLNLLPWREQLREEQKRQFFTALGGCIVLSILIVILMHTVIARRIEQQQSVNLSLQKEITSLNKQIREVTELKKEKAEMLQRLELIHKLQASRPLTVRLYDELVRIIPPGVYIQHVKREKQKVTVVGKAESNTRVSDLMRNIEKSPWLANPVLSEIKTDTSDQTYQRNFILQFLLEHEKKRRNLKQ